MKKVFPNAAAALADVVASLERRFKRKLNATVQVQTDLIGGIRVVVGDEVLFVTAGQTVYLLANGTVAGTVILLHDSGLKDADIEPLLSSLDDEFLPDVDLAHGNLTYTIVRGEVLGNWEAEKKQAD